MDTQGLTLPSDKPINRDIQYPPLEVKKRTVFTDLERKELKEIINEVLDEREQRYYETDDSWLYRGTY